MEDLREKVDQYSDIWDADFSDCEDSFLCEDVQFSSVERILGSKTSVSRSKSNIENLNQNKVPINVRKLGTEYSCSPNSKRKRIQFPSVKDFSTFDINISQSNILKNSVNIYLENHTSTSSPIANVLNQEKCDKIISSQGSSNSKMDIGSQGSSKYDEDMIILTQKSFDNKMITSSQEEISNSQKMSTSSQEEISNSQKMITSSQENCPSQYINSSQESCKSPKMIASSQESLCNRIMKNSIQEVSNSITTASISNSDTRIIITPHRKKPIYKEVKSLKSNIVNQETANLKSLMIRIAESSDSETVSSKKMKIYSISDSPGKNEFSENLMNSASDPCKKPCRLYSKTEKKIVWNIRKRELRVTKRENAVEMREKLLESREANVSKREEILKARERKYLKCKINMKNMMQKIAAYSKKLRKRGNFLEDETNTSNK